MEIYPKDHLLYNQFSAEKFSLIFWSRWTENIHKLKMVPKLYKYSLHSCVPKNNLVTFLVEGFYALLISVSKASVNTVCAFCLFYFIFLLCTTDCLKNRPQSWTWWLWWVSCSSCGKPLSLSSSTQSQTLETIHWLCPVHTFRCLHLLQCICS